MVPERGGMTDFVFSKIVIAPVNCQNLSKMTDFGPNPKKICFLSNLTDIDFKI